MKGQTASQILRQELRQAGARDAELEDLLAVGAGLQRLQNQGVTTAKTSDAQSRAQVEPIRERTKAARLIPFGLTGLVGAALGMGVMVLSQTVLPGSLLYPVQKLSDSVAVSIDPDYRGSIMMKRAEQVKQLVAQRADPGIVLAALSDYQAEAASYKSVSANYAVFEYCKASLQQAAAAAPAHERQAIGNVLQSLANV